jgi:hypothetical protein
MESRAGCKMTARWRVEGGGWEVERLKAGHREGRASRFGDQEVRDEEQD